VLITYRIIEAGGEEKHLSSKEQGMVDDGKNPIQMYLDPDAGRIQQKTCISWNYSSGNEEKRCAKTQAAVKHSVFFLLFYEVLLICSACL